MFEKPLGWTKPPEREGREAPGYPWGMRCCLPRSPPSAEISVPSLRLTSSCRGGWCQHKHSDQFLPPLPPPAWSGSSADSCQGATLASLVSTLPGPLCHSSDSPQLASFRALPPQDLCTGRYLYLEGSSSHPSLFPTAHSPASFRSSHRCHLLTL